MGDTVGVCAGTQTGPGGSATMNTSNTEHPLPRTQETIMSEQDHTIDTDTDTDDTEGNHFSRGRIQPTDDTEGNHFGRGRLNPADGTEEPNEGRFHGAVQPAEGADDVEGHGIKHP
jgi:hypothetical protein